LPENESNQETEPRASSQPKSDKLPEDTDREVSLLYMKALSHVGTKRSTSVKDLARFLGIMEEDAHMILARLAKDGCFCGKIDLTKGMKVNKEQVLAMKDKINSVLEGKTSLSQVFRKSTKRRMASWKQQSSDSREE